MGYQASLKKGRKEIFKYFIEQGQPENALSYAYKNGYRNSPKIFLKYGQKMLEMNWSDENMKTAFSNMLRQLESEAK